VVFDDLRGVVGRALGNLAVTIEHVGSTAVPGLSAKPIIDFDVVIESAERLPEVVPILATLGYTHQGDLGIPSREAFDCQGSDVPRDGFGRMWQEHHLYVCSADSRELRRHLAFRDFLRANADQFSAYASLKRQLAQRFRDDRDAYCRGKTDFIEKMLERTMG
jgi:GrpB-like predicted nucleotidyltransferase (UPF0157 family)